MAQNTNPVAPIGDLAHTAIEGVEDVGGAGARVLIASAMQTLQLARDTINAAQHLVDTGVDFIADDVLDAALARMQEYVQSPTAQ